ncbi:MAG: hypothetical protein KIS81_01915 [Maricaulaceae bacterium]|nr:hypothetical protein [Maricaulaceae bacterium]
MAQFAIAFDLNNTLMRAPLPHGGGMTAADVTRVYQAEIPQALASCGFTVHAQGSLYHTESNEDAIIALMQLKGALQTQAPNFCRFVNRVHVFRMENWSDITTLIANRPAAPAPDAEEEIEEQDAIAAAG